MTPTRKRSMADDPVVEITVDGTTHTIDFSALTALDARDFRAAVGLSLTSVLFDHEDPDVDVVAGLVWLARRATEPEVTYGDVAGSINLRSAVGMEPGEVASDPER